MNTEKPINTLIREYTEQMDARQYVQKNTLWVLERFVKWMVVSGIDVRNPRKADVVHYKNDLIKDGKTPTTVNRYLAPVRCFFNWLADNNIYDNVAAGVKSPPDDRAFRRDYLKPEQVVKLLSVIQTNTIVGLRDYAMITLMYFLGLRRIEVHRLSVGDISNDDIGYIFKLQRKGRDYKESVRVDAEVFKPVELYLLKRNNYTDASPLFANHSNRQTETLSTDTISRIIKNYLKQVSNSSKLTCHSLRHSAAINLLQSGYSIYEVRNMLGHKSIETTQVYLKAIEAENRFNNTAVRALLDIHNNNKKKGNYDKIVA